MPYGAEKAQFGCFFLELVMCYQNLVELRPRKNDRGQDKG